MRKIDRFDLYMKIKGLNDNKVTCALGLSVGIIGKSRQNGRDLSSRVTEQILNFYNDINRVWFLTGEGDMLTSSSSVSATNNSAASFSGDASVHISPCDSIELIELFKQSQQIAENAQNITKKSQEQIDNLINLIHKMTNNQ